MITLIFPKWSANYLSKNGPGFYISLNVSCSKGYYGVNLNKPANTINGTECALAAAASNKEPELLIVPPFAITAWGAIIYTYVHIHIKYIWISY